jgi:hypothetical protein
VADYLSLLIMLTMRKKFVYWYMLSLDTKETRQKMRQQSQVASSAGNEGNN